MSKEQVRELRERKRALERELKQLSRDEAARTKERDQLHRQHAKLAAAELKRHTAIERELSKIDNTLSNLGAK